MSRFTSPEQVILDLLKLGSIEWKRRYADYRVSKGVYVFPSVNKTVSKEKKFNPIMKGFIDSGYKFNE